MIRPVRVEYEMKATLPATPEAIEGFFAEFRRNVEGQAGRADRFTAELLLREALTNSVRHGCRGDSTKHVRCILRLRGRQLTIAVSDQGMGFDWRALGKSEDESLSPCGRGVEILRRYATRVRFNDKGNSVTMIKRFS